MPGFIQPVAEQSPNMHAGFALPNRSVYGNEQTPTPA
jgi:hypothetical protein